MNQQPDNVQCIVVQDLPVEYIVIEARRPQRVAPSRCQIHGKSVVPSCSDRSPLAPAIKQFVLLCFDSRCRRRYHVDQARRQVRVLALSPVCTYCIKSYLVLYCISEPCPHTRATPVPLGYNGGVFEGKGPKGGAFDEEQTAYRFTLGQGSVIPGLDEGITGMKAGGVRQIVVPPEVSRRLFFSLFCFHEGYARSCFACTCAT